MGHSHQVLKYLAIATLISASNAYGLFLDGKGHYSLKGVTQTNPGFSSKQGTHQALEQSFLLEGEARLNDRASFFLDFRLFDSNRGNYLGDTAEPTTCAPRATNSERTEFETDCAGRVQDQDIPGYEPFTPQVTAAYARYAFDYCIIEAGRRPRHWGLGILLNKGHNPYDPRSSYFDGATCKVNMQKSQAIGFSIGYDKLQETGEVYDNPYDDKNGDIANFQGDKQGFGAASRRDDMDQFFFTLEFDDRNEKAPSSLRKVIGIYFANILSSEADGLKNDDGSQGEVHARSSSDVKYLDLYTGLYLGNFAWNNELVFRMGRSNAPIWVEYGGDRYHGNKGAVIQKNDLNAIGIAGNLQWIMSSEGTFDGPKEFNQGNLTRHLLQFDYAIAPGDEDSYARDYYNRYGEVEAITDQSKKNEGERDTSVTAMAFHPSYKPALIMFNGPPSTDDLTTAPGAFQNYRLVNATMLALSYKYESIQYGNFTTKFITASLLEGVPQDIKDLYENKHPEAVKPIGYNGKDLGFELDLQYSYLFGKEVSVGVDAGLAFPGKAWEIYEGETPKNSFLVQTHVNFFF